ncbi:MAG: penicillin-insensitive murein endopeptidase, partial [Polyangiaceae bacterium]|nr:penicillin-insensitive murein endopeptidase [Polyangiaceae bacterium]
MRFGQVMLTVGVLVYGVPVTGRAAEPGPPSDAEARAWLAMPRGSVSLGKTSAGSLHAAAQLPPKGKGYQVLSHAVGRKTNYGTEELVAVIDRATRAVAEAFPGSKLGIGNLGFESGEKIPWSVSHQSGRDADLGMYARDEAGQPLEALPFVYYGEDGTAKLAGGKVVHFDVARNLALVTALVGDVEARVQYIFVAAWLKAKLLSEARRSGTSQTIIQRLEEVLHQPTDSNPHADHFHVRLFCTIEDRLHGCQNREPPRRWVDLGDAEHAARSRELARVFLLGRDALHVAALEKLAAIRGTTAMDAVVGELGHSAKKVRKAALATLVAWADPAAADKIVGLLPSIRDAAWASALFQAIPELDAASLVPLARKVATAPESVLHADVQKKAGVALQVAALKILKEHGGAAEVPLLVELAESRQKKVAAAAREALAWVTCQPAATRFAAWWPEHRGEDVVTWLRGGLAARKKKVPANLRTRAGVELLIPLVAAGDGGLRPCAGRALVAITGHEFDARLRSPARNR